MVGEEWRELYLNNNKKRKKCLLKRKNNYNLKKNICNNLLAIILQIFIVKHPDGPSSLRNPGSGVLHRADAQKREGQSRESAPQEVPPFCVQNKTYNPTSISTYG